MTIFVAAISALILAMIGVPLMRRIATRYGALDHPGERKIHQLCTPRLGGAAIVLGLGGAVLFLKFFGSIGSLASDPIWTVLMVGTPIAFGIGLWDDFFSIGSKRKFVGQLLLGAVIYMLGFRIDSVSLGPGYHLSFGLFSFPFTLIWVAAVMNAVNLIDGIDGLASGVCVISFVTIALLAQLFGNPVVSIAAWISAASVFGFLCFNFSPAKIFMGDSGSMTLGFLLAVLSLSITPSGSVMLPVYVPMLVLSLPLVDVTVAVLRRIIRVAHLERFSRSEVERVKVSTVLQRVFSADGDHIHHRLISRGFSHRQVSLILYGFSGLGAGLAFFVLALPAQLSWLLGVAALVAVWQMVLSLGYTEFAPKSIRQHEQIPEWEDAFSRQVSVIRRIS